MTVNGHLATTTKTVEITPVDARAGLVTGSIVSDVGDFADVTSVKALIDRLAIESIAEDLFRVDTTDDAQDEPPGDGECETDAGQCTLRAAVMESNASPGPNSIELPAGTYMPNIIGPTEDGGLTGDFDITDDLTIIGAGATDTVIDGLASDRLFHILPGASPSMSSATFTSATGGTTASKSSPATASSSSPSVRPAAERESSSGPRA